MTRNEFIHQAMLQMTGNGKIFSANMHSRQKEIDEIRDAAVALADAAQETAPFDEWNPETLRNPSRTHTRARYGFTPIANPPKPPNPVYRYKYYIPIYRVLGSILGDLRRADPRVCDIQTIDPIDNRFGLV